LTFRAQIHDRSASLLGQPLHVSKAVSQQ